MTDDRGQIVCPQCQRVFSGEDLDNNRIEFLNVHSNIYGEDVITFRCVCGEEVESLVYL